MADRGAANTFGEIFEHLAESPNQQNKELARWLWNGPMRGHDFAWQQMELDAWVFEALSITDLKDES